jgi:hypothetical protein
MFDDKLGCLVNLALGAPKSCRDGQLRYKDLGIA